MPRHYVAGSILPSPRRPAMARAVNALGDLNDAAYVSWATSVKNAGGVATALNVNGQVTATARYPLSIFQPLVDAGKWPAPDKLTADGQYGYYYAPDAVQAVDLSQPTAAEVPDLTWSDAIVSGLRKIAIPAVIGAAALWFAHGALTGAGERLFEGKR